MQSDQLTLQQKDQFSQDFKSKIDEDIQNIDNFIQDLQNTQTKLEKEKEERLFETSQKSLLVSIQRSRKILSNINSSRAVSTGNRGSIDNIQETGEKALHPR